MDKVNKARKVARQVGVDFVNKRQFPHPFVVQNGKGRVQFARGGDPAKIKNTKEKQTHEKETLEYLACRSDGRSDLSTTLWI